MVKKDLHLVFIDSGKVYDSARDIL